MSKANTAHGPEIEALATRLDRAQDLPAVKAVVRDILDVVASVALTEAERNLRMIRSVS